MLEKRLFGAVKWTKHVDIDLYKYSGYGIRFDRKRLFFNWWWSWLKYNNFGVKTSSSPHIGNKKKDILLLGKGPIQGLEHTLAAENCIQSTVLNTIQNFAWACIIMEQSKRFKAKDSEIVTMPLCLENIAKDWSVDNIKKNWIKRICLWF